MYIPITFIDTLNARSVFAYFELALRSIYLLDEAAQTSAVINIVIAKRTVQGCLLSKAKMNVIDANASPAILFLYSATDMIWMEVRPRFMQKVPLWVNIVQSEILQTGISLGCVEIVSIHKNRMARVC